MHTYTHTHTHTHTRDSSRTWVVNEACQAALGGQEGLGALVSAAGKKMYIRKKKRARGLGGASIRGR